MAKLLIAHNPDPDSTLPYLLRLPLAGGMVFHTSGTWPRTKALFCYQVSADEWPADPDIVERTRLRSCVRRGAAIDVVLDRSRESRSQIVFTKARGRDVVFWQSPRTRKQARPNVRTPTARAAGITELEIVIDSHEQYAYRFGGQQVRTVKRALPCGDYGITLGGRLVASVERKSLVDLVASLTGGKLRFAVAELAALPRAALVVEDRYSQVFKLDRIRPSLVADGLAELQIRWPNVPIVLPPPRRGMDLPVPRRGPRLGRDRARLPHAAHPAGRQRHRDRTRPSTRRATTLYRRSPGLGPRHRPHRPRPRQTPPPHLERLAQSPQHLTSASFADASANGLPAETQSQDHLPQIRIRLNTDAGSQGGFNWSSQHLDDGGVDGSSSTCRRSGDPAETPFAGASEVSAPCRGGVLGEDRQRSPCGGGRTGDRRGAGGRCTVVPQRWRHATV